MAGNFKWTKQSTLNAESMNHADVQAGPQARKALPPWGRRPLNAAVIGLPMSLYAATAEYGSSDRMVQDAVVCKIGEKMLLGVNKDSRRMFEIEEVDGERLLTVAIEQGSAPAMVVPGLWVPSLQRFHTAEDPQIVDETSIEEVRTAYEATQILPSPA